MKQKKIPKWKYSTEMKAYIKSIALNGYNRITNSKLNDQINRINKQVQANSKSNTTTTRIEYICGQCKQTSMALVSKTKEKTELYNASTRCSICLAFNTIILLEYCYRLQTEQITLKDIPNKVKEYNKEIIELLNQQKPAAGASKIIIQPPHKRYRAIGFSGIECKKCQTLITLDNNTRIYEPIPLVICPRCNTEQRPEIKELIKI